MMAVGIRLSRTWHVFVMDLVARPPSKRCNSAAGFCQPPSGMKTVYRARASTFFPCLPRVSGIRLVTARILKKRLLKKRFNRTGVGEA